LLNFQRNKDSRNGKKINIIREVEITPVSNAIAAINIMLFDLVIYLNINIEQTNNIADKGKMSCPLKINSQNTIDVEHKSKNRSAVVLLNV